MALVHRYPMTIKLTKRGHSKVFRVCPKRYHVEKKNRDAAEYSKWSRHHWLRLSSPTPRPLSSCMTVWSIGHCDSSFTLIFTPLLFNSKTPTTSFTYREASSLSSFPPNKLSPPTHYTATATPITCTLYV